MERGENWSPFTNQNYIWKSEIAIALHGLHVLYNVLSWRDFVLILNCWNFNYIKKKRNKNDFRSRQSSAQRLVRTVFAISSSKYDTNDTHDRNKFNALEHNEDSFMRWHLSLVHFHLSFLLSLHEIVTVKHLKRGLKGERKSATETCICIKSRYMYIGLHRTSRDAIYVAFMK